MFISSYDTGWFVVIVTASLAMILVFFFLLFIHSSRRHITHIKEVHKLQKDFHSALMESQLEIQEQTFKQISQEIHDNIGQMLTLAKLNINTLERELGEVYACKFNDLNNMLTKAIQDLRDISKSLNSDAISQVGIAKAIQNELGIIGKITRIETRCECNINSPNLDPHIELILFRIIQESLHNIMKHARATAIMVSMVQVDNALFVKIKDDGVGFDTRDKSILGNGLMNIENRCKLINATFNIESTHGEGTVITLNIPVTWHSLVGSGVEVVDV